MNTLQKIIRHQYVRFFIVGGSGVVLNLAVTWFLTTFFFGENRYFTAFIIGTTLNLLYTFTLYTLRVFRTTTRHVRRFVIYVLYCLVMTLIQLSVVKWITSLVGVHFYLVVIVVVTFIFSFVN